MLDVRIIRAGQPLSRQAIEQSPEALVALEAAHAFDQALARHGAPTSMRIPPGFEVRLRETTDRASGAAGYVELSTSGERFRTSPALLPDVVAHEFAHGAMQRAALTVRQTDEGWPDAVARAIAIEGGDDAARPWSMARDGFRAADGGWGDMRDPMTERITTVAQLERRNALATAYEQDRYSEETFDALAADFGKPIPTWARGRLAIGYVTDPHHDTAMVTKPAALASAELGASMVASAYLDAFPRLPRYLQQARQDATAANRAGMSGYMASRGYAELLASARATIDAADAIGGRGAGEVIRAAWREVGVAE